MFVWKTNSAIVTSMLLAMANVSGYWCMRNLLITQRLYEWLYSRLMCFICSHVCAAFSSQCSVDYVM